MAHNFGMFIGLQLPMERVSSDMSPGEASVDHDHDIATPQCDRNPISENKYYSYVKLYRKL